VFLASSVDAPARSATDQPGVPLRRAARMAINIPTDLLRSFLAIVDSGSMAQATSTVFLTQSALSLQMKRLEDLLQQRVFQRQGRSLLLTAAGEELVSLARQLLAVNDRIVASLGAEIAPEPLTLGLVQDFADTILPGVLASFAQNFPSIRFQLRIGGSAELLDLFDRTKLDVLVCLGRHGELRHGTSEVVAEAPMAWIGDPSCAQMEPIPLVLLEAPCAFRTALLETLERQQRAYRIVLETPSLPGLRAALLAGIGISCRTQSYAEHAGIKLISSAGLPQLPWIDNVILSRNPATQAARDLTALFHQSFRQAPAPMIAPP